MNVSGVLLE